MAYMIWIMIYLVFGGLIFSVQRMQFSNKTQEQLDDIDLDQRMGLEAAFGSHMWLILPLFMIIWLPVTLLAIIKGLFLL